MTEYDLGIILAVLIALGILGNSAAFVILLRGRRCRKLFCSAYLMALAVTDTVILALPAMELCLYLLTNEFLLGNVNQFLCKFIIFLMYFGEQLSSWIIVGVSVTRALSIWMPLRSHAWRNKTAVPYLVIISVVFFIVDLPFLIDAERYTIVLDGDLLQNLTDLFNGLNITELDNLPSTGNDTLEADWLKGLNFTDSGGILGLSENRTAEVNDSALTFDGSSLEISFCVLKGESVYAEGKLLKPIALDICLIFAIPFCIITTSNFSIIARLIKSLRTIKVTQGGQTNMKDTRMISLALRIFILSTVHLVSTGPIAIADVMKASSVDTNVYFTFRNTPLYRAFNLLFYLNSGANFALYCLFGNEFRQDLYDMLRLKKKRIRKILC